MQKELMALVGYYIDADVEFKKSEAGSSTSSLFSFANSAAFSAPEDSSSSKKWDYAELQLGAPSPYRLAPLYPVIVTFSDAALALLVPLYVICVRFRSSSLTWREMQESQVEYQNVD